MIIKLFRFTKRENSTKRPNMADGVDFDCTLKDETSVVSPTVMIDFGNYAGFTFNYNYAYIPEFNRYYFISDMVSIGYIWSVYLASDVLATFKGVIGSTSLYVLRSSAAYDGNVVDTAYPVKSAYTVDIQHEATPWEDPDHAGWIDVTRGSFIIGCVSSTGTAGRYGSINYYILDRDNLAALCASLLSDSILSGFSTNDGTLELQKAIIDPLSYIKSCIWFPFPIDQTVVTTGLPIWKWIAQCDYTPMRDNPPWKLHTIGYTVPRHPNSAARGNYLNIEPYTKMTLTIPPFGIIELDTTKTAGTQRIGVVICTDLITGNSIMDVTTQEGIYLGKYSGQVGVPIQLSQVSRDYLSSIQQTGNALTSAVGGFMDKNAAVGYAISSINSLIGAATTAMRPIESTRGSNGGYADLRGRATLQACFFQPVDEDNAHLGRPLCQERTPASLGGYILAREGDIEIQGYATEQAAVKEFLETGFYYE